MVIRRQTLDAFLKSPYLREIGGASQGTCYLDTRTGIVYKIFHQYFDHEDEILYEENELVKFNDVSNSTYVWNEEVIIVDGMIIGVTCKYANAQSLYKINPFSISLDKLVKSIEKAYVDIKTISDNGILTYDVMYNILYGKSGFKIIDTQEYSQSCKDSKTLEYINRNNFNAEIMYFLVDGFFDEFVLSSKKLREMYQYRGINVVEFINILRGMLSETLDTDVNRLSKAKKLINKASVKCHYEREI